MTAPTAVAVLMLHNQSCSQCRVGEPCVVTERILDDWMRRQAATSPEPEAACMATEDAA
ncbi:hypothetical protein [Dyella acidisoli]|nr:hypothetical protein [Dyella acidisoli]